MNVSDYQGRARETAIYDEKYKIMYPALGLAGETGEVCDKIKKIYRDNEGVVTEEKKKELSKELGDVAWYLANLASDLDLNLGKILAENIEKLKSRAERGVLGGDGDNR